MGNRLRRAIKAMHGELNRLALWRKAFKLGKFVGALHPGNAFRHLDLNARWYGLR